MPSWVGLHLYFVLVDTITMFAVQHLVASSAEFGHLLLPFLCQYLRRSGLHKYTPSVRIDYLRVQEETARTSQIQDASRHIGIIPRPASRIAQLLIDLALLLVITHPRCHLTRKQAGRDAIHSDFGLRQRRCQHARQVDESRLARRVGELTS